MEKKSIFIIHSLGVLVFVIGVFMLSIPLLAKSPAGSPSEGGSDVYLFGIIDPDGHKHFWALPAETKTAISKRLATQYPRKTIDGIHYYRVTSWRDTSKLVIEANAQQGRLVADLFFEIERLKKKSHTQLARRVNKLEKQVNHIANNFNPR
jgi:hypothetical protein